MVLMLMVLTMTDRRHLQVTGGRPVAVFLDLLHSWVNSMMGRLLQRVRCHVPENALPPRALQRCELISPEADRSALTTACIMRKPTRPSAPTIGMEPYNQYCDVRALPTDSDCFGPAIGQELSALIHRGIRSHSKHVKMGQVNSQSDATT